MAAVGQQIITIPEPVIVTGMSNVVSEYCMLDASTVTAASGTFLY